MTGVLLLLSKKTSVLLGALELQSNPKPFVSATGLMESSIRLQKLTLLTLILGPTALEASKMTITLTEHQLKTLLLAAEEAQVVREHELAKMRENPDYERHEIMHFTSKIKRTDDVILESEKKLIFPS
tara:strand:+ start:72 stop:455 length:384 start_codon:yes stop_codon:yes gene_type:complete